VPKWTAQLVRGFRRFDRAENEIIYVTIASKTNPADTTRL
jgi:hypothetical protein